MKTKKKLTRLFWLMAMVFAMGSALPGKAAAASKIVTDTAWIGYTDALYFDCEGFFYDPAYDFGGTPFPTGIKIVSAKSGNPGILKVKKSGSGVHVQPKKPGKCKVTVKYKDEAGKTRTTSKVIIMV